MASNRDIWLALATSVLSAIAGSVLSALLLCVISVFGFQSHPIENLVVIPALWIMSFLIGLFFAFPTALLIGMPLIWLIGDRVSSWKSLAAVFALIGALLGWGIFIAVGDDSSGLDGIAKIACPIYGAIVAGLHPIIAVWLIKEGRKA